MKRGSQRPVVGAICGAAGLLIGALPAAALTNSDFEGDAVDSAPAGWTIVDEKIDLGVSTVAGCRTVDTSTYGTLRNFAAYAFPDFDYGDGDSHPNLSDYEDVVIRGESAQAEIGGVPVWHNDRNDAGRDIWVGPLTATSDAEFTQLKDLPAADREAMYSAYGILPTERRDNDASSEFDDGGRHIKVVDGSAITDFEDEDTGETYSYVRSGKVLEFFSDLDDGSGGMNGYVFHGPAIYSDVFPSGPGRQLSLWWAASGDKDDFHIFGYLLNVDTCEQTEVLDATGLASAWQRTRASVTEEGNYRFVFVSGSYDQTWGGAAGALLWIDDISEEIDEDPPTPVTPDRPTLTNAGLDTTVALLGVVLVAVGAGVLARRRRYA